MSFKSDPLPIGEPQENLMKINRSRGRIESTLLILDFRDNDTKQYVAYAPALEVSGYGETVELALEMLTSALEDVFSYFLDLPEHKMASELANLGWSRHRMFPKEFSHLSIDENGLLQGLNAEEGTLNRRSLQAA